jgi:hypothetical protein
MYMLLTPLTLPQRLRPLLKVGVWDRKLVCMVCSDSAQVWAPLPPQCTLHVADGPALHCRLAVRLHLLQCPMLAGGCSYPPQLQLACRAAPAPAHGFGFGLCDWLCLITAWADSEPESLTRLQPLNVELGQFLVPFPGDIS